MGSHFKMRFAFVMSGQRCLDMPLFKTSNPALSSNTFSGVSDSSYGGGISGAQYGGAISTTSGMTLSGTVNKTGILLVLAVVGRRLHLEPVRGDPQPRLRIA